MGYGMSGNHLACEDTYEPTPEDCGYVRIDEFHQLEDQLKDVAHFAEGMAEAFYKTGNVILLQHCLNQIQEILKINRPKTPEEIKMERKGSRDEMNYFLGFQHGVLHMTRETLRV